MSSPVDTLTSAYVKDLLYDKYILILGDSVVRGLYKDLIKFFNSDTFLHDDDLRVKGENRFCGDRLIHGGVQKNLTNGTDYEEVREYTGGGCVRIRFYFLTRCYSNYMTRVIFSDIENQAIKPDIIIMNSCVWDISRYGLDAIHSYQKNMDRVMGSFRQILPQALFLWLSALPASNSSKGGVIVPKAEYIRPILPGLIRDGNYHCSQMCNTHNVLYVDLHTIFSHMSHLRQPDGIHWCAIGNRIINEIILNHIKAYYTNVKSFQCPQLRRELGDKMNTYKQRMKSHSSKTDQDELYQSSRTIASKNRSLEISVNFKRKRTNNDDEETEEKENKRLVVMPAAELDHAKRTVIIKKLDKKLDNPTPLNQSILPFDHDYVDAMYDNEYEGLSLFHFASSDDQTCEEHVSPSSHETEVPSNSSINPITTNLNASEFLIKSDHEERSTVEPDCIILSSDDEDDPLSVLPIYLLNRQLY